MKIARKMPESWVVRAGFAGQVVCYASSVGVLLLVLYRLPSFAETRRDMLFGTILVACMSLLLALIGLVVHLTTMTYRVIQLGKASVADVGHPAAG